MARKMKNRLLFLASLSVASSLAWSFDVEIKGQNMSQALKQISPLVGLNLQASGQIANEVVYIRAKNAEPNAFLEQLTSATGLEWVKSGDIYTLTLTSNAKQKLLTESKSVQDLQISQAIESRLETGGRKQTFDYISEVKSAIEAPNSYQSSRNRLQLNSPMQDSIIWIWQSEKASVLSNLPENGRTVFSTAPTNRQQRMTAAMRNAIEAGATAYRNILSESIKGMQAGKRVPIGGLRNLQQTQTIFNRAINKANFVVTRRNGKFEFQLQYVDSNGQFIDQVSSSSLNLDSNIIPAQLTSYTWPSVDRTSDSAIFSFAQAALTRDRTVRYLDRNIDTERLELKKKIVNPVPFAAGVDLETRNQLLNPEDNDPLGVLISPFLDQEPAENIIAILPDSIAPSLAGALVTGNSPKFLGSLRSVVKSNDGNWLTIRPADRLNAIETRFDRSALKDIVIALSKNYGLLSVNDLINYAIKNERGVPNAGLDVAFVDWIFEQDAANQLDRTHGEGWFDHIIFAKLGATQRLTNFAQAPTIVQPFNDQFYNSTKGGADKGRVEASKDSNFQFQAASEVQVYASNAQPGRFFEANSAEFQQRVNGAAERTDRVPFGISNTAPANLFLKAEDRLLAIDHSTGRKISYNAADFGNLLAMANFGGSRIYPASAEVFDEYVYISSEYRVITVEIENGYTISAMVSGFKPVGKPGDFDNLPAGFLRNIDNAYEKLDQQYGERLTRTGNDGRNTGRRGGRRGGGTIPPID